MGDVAISVPVLRSLMDGNENVEVTLLTRGFFAPFFDGLGTTIIDFRMKDEHKGLRGLLRLFGELKKERFDTVIDLQGKLASRVLEVLFWFRRVRTRRIDKGRKGKRALTRQRNKRLVRQRPIAERYADVFRRAGFEIDIDYSLQRQTRPIPPYIQSLNITGSAPWIGISPGSVHRGKIYPDDKIREVATELAAHYPVFIFGGGKSEEAFALSLEKTSPNIRSLIGKMTLRQELDMMANLCCMVSMDSSAMHLCSLVGTPVVSLWGATHPFAGFMGIGQSPDNAVQFDLDCRPCSVFGSKPCYKGTYECMAGIPPSAIVNKVLQIGGAESFAANNH